MMLSESHTAPLEQHALMPRDKPALLRKSALPVGVQCCRTVSVVTNPHGISYTSCYNLKTPENAFNFLVSGR